MRGSLRERGARSREAKERSSRRENRSECVAVCGQLLVLFSAVALTMHPINVSECATELVLFLLGWGVMTSA